MAGASVAIKNIGKSFDTLRVLSGVNLTIEPGEFLTLLGPSGCGKSTLLRMIAGFETPNEGSLEIGGKRVDGLRPKERGVSMVFQNYALYPHMTVFGNIAMPLVMRQMSFWERFPAIGHLVPGARAKRARIADRVSAIARTLEIDGLLTRKPGQLSGGQRQRVALGRAIAPQPDVFLMDEPLSNLDARLRIQMRSELTELHRRLGITFIYVTHDQVEAMTMSQRVAIVMDGEIVQVGTPSDVYLRPADLRVARFIGAHPINVLEVERVSGEQAGILGQPVSTDPTFSGGYAAFRPEDARLEFEPARRAHDLQAEVKIVRVEDHGNEVLVHIMPEHPGSESLMVRMPGAFRNEARPDAKVRLTVPAASLHWFDEDGVRVPSVDSEAPASATTNVVELAL